MHAPCCTGARQDQILAIIIISNGFQDSRHENTEVIDLLGYITVTQSQAQMHTFIRPIFAHNPPLSHNDMSVGVLTCLQAPFFSSEEIGSPHKSTANHHGSNRSFWRTTTTFPLSSSDRLITECIISHTIIRKKSIPMHELFCIL